MLFCVLFWMKHKQRRASKVPNDSCPSRQAQCSIELTFWQLGRHDEDNENESFSSFILLKDRTPLAKAANHKYRVAVIRLVVIHEGLVEWIRLKVFSRCFLPWRCFSFWERKFNRKMNNLNYQIKIQHRPSKVTAKRIVATSIRVNGSVSAFEYLINNGWFDPNIIQIGNSIHSSLNLAVSVVSTECEVTKQDEHR